ncbi:MAG: hypothetical protein M3405_06340, partial [Acidobacteriota bacterium]|nr:hypothetical protein [Acidobacteriota bacterium]
MKKLFAVLFSITVFVALNITLSAQDRQIARKYLPNNSVESIKFVQSDELKGILTSAVNDTLKDFADKGLKSNEIAATLIDMRLPDKLARADYRGNEQIYPASVVKMFYMATLFRQIEDGKV